MTETFEVGQKVKHTSYGDVEVTYGPFHGRFTPTAYLVRHEDGRETVASVGAMTAIPETPKFTVGDVVSLATRSGAKATVEYGPFDDRDVYVVKLVDEPADEDDVRTFTAMAHVMTKADGDVKVGDRVRIVKDDDYMKPGEFIGRTGVLRESHPDGRGKPFRVRLDDPSGTWNDGSWWVAEVERVEDENLYTHAGVTYDLTADYRDKDGDGWKLRRSPDRRDVVQAQMAPVEADEWGYYTLPTLITKYGPLTRI